MASMRADGAAQDDPAPGGSGGVVRSAPWVIWWIGELTGARTRDAEVEGSKGAANFEGSGALEVHAIRSRADCESLLARLSPGIVVRFEDLSRDGDLAEAKLRFSKLADFDIGSIAAAVPAVARCGDPRAEAPEAADARSGQGGGDLARLIAQALRGEVSNSGEVPKPGCDARMPGTLRERQVAELRRDAGFARVERSWRSLARLSALLDGAGAVEIRALDVADASIARGLAILDREDSSPFADACEDLSLGESDRPELVVLDREFGMDASGFEQMRGLARLATVLAAPVVFGCALPDPEDMASASAVERVFRSLMLAPLRTLRQEPASQLLAPVVGAVSRSREDGTADWIQSGGPALAEAIIPMLSPASTAVAGGAGRVPLGTRPLRAGAGQPTLRIEPAAMDALSMQGLSSLCADPEEQRSVRTGAVLSTLRALPSGSDPRAADLRLRMVSARLANAMTRAVRRMERPSNNAASLRKFCDELAARIPPEALLLLGSAENGMLDPAAPVALSAQYLTHDERSLRIDLELRPRSGHWTGASVARAAFFPLAFG